MPIRDITRDPGPKPILDICPELPAIPHIPLPGNAERLRTTLEWRKTRRREFAASIIKDAEASQSKLSPEIVIVALSVMYLSLGLLATIVKTLKTHNLNYRS
jgi:hypothetical protein